MKNKKQKIKQITDTESTNIAKHINGLKPGNDEQLLENAGIMTIYPKIKNPVEIAAGFLKGSDSLKQNIVEEHRQARINEA